MRIAAIDCGTNSIHMIVVRIRPDLSFEVIDREKEMVRLGSGGLDGKALTPEAVQTGLQTFSRFRRLADSHQVEEIQNVLTDVMFMDRGRIVFGCSMDEIESRYVEVTVNPERAPAARVLKPMHERQMLGRSIFLFDGADRQQLAALGDVRTPGIADLFVAVLENVSGGAA